MRDPKRLQRGGGACIRADYQHPPSSKCGPLPLSFCLPEDVLQHIRGQRGRAEHHKQALLGFTVGGRQLLQGRQADVRLDTGHGGRRRETLPGKTQAFMPVCSPVVEMQTSKIHPPPPPCTRGKLQSRFSHEVSAFGCWTLRSTQRTSSEQQQTAWPSAPPSYRRKHT